MYMQINVFVYLYVRNYSLNVYVYMFVFFLKKKRVVGVLLKYVEFYQEVCQYKRLQLLGLLMYCIQIFFNGKFIMVVIGYYLQIIFQLINKKSLYKLERLSCENLICNLIVRICYLIWVGIFD